MIEHKKSVRFSLLLDLLLKAILFCALVSSSGCGEGADVKAARTDLELANLKSDIDGIFTATKRLADLGDEAAERDMDRVRKLVSSQEEMLLAVADHDHEKAVLAASALLSQAPNHPGATKTLRESGQIFYFLILAKEEAKRFAVGEA